MKQVFLFLLSFSLLCAHAADPTIPASNLQFPSASIEGASFRVTFNIGNGTGGRIVVVKEGSDITGQPVDGVRYTASAVFGTAGTEFTAPGEFVVAHTTNTVATIDVSSLKPGTTYYVAVFELNGNYATPASIDYSVVTPTNKMVSTKSAPTMAPTITGFTQITGNSLRINWTNGNGQGRLVVAKKGNTLTAVPTNLKFYNSDPSFGTNSGLTYQLEPGTFVLFKASTQTFADISNLEPNTDYTFAVYEFNGSSSPVYLTMATPQSVTTNSGPSLAPTSLNFTVVDGNRLDFSWNRGNGSQTLVVVKKGSPVTNVPINGVNYPASTTFGTPASEWYAGSEEYVINSSANISGFVAGLEKSTTYHFAIFAFDADANGFKYYGATSLQRNQNTAVAPTGQTSISVSNITGSSAQLTFIPPASGVGAFRMLVIKDGGPVTFIPQDLTLYTGFTDTYGLGTLLEPNTYTLYYQANGGAPNVKGLLPGHTYHVTVFEMNGKNAPVYKVPGGSATIVIPNEPTTASAGPLFPTVEGNSIRFDWTNGNGARRIVVVRKEAAVSFLPQDGSVYTSAGVFGTAAAETSAGSGQYVMYDGSGNTVTMTGLEKGTTYHFAVFEYNLQDGVPNYLTAATKWLAASRATLSAPTAQTTGINILNLQPTQADFNFTMGNGSSRIFVMREGGPVNALPADYTRYSTVSSIFGDPSAQLGTDNYIVASSSSNFSVTGLEAGKTYHITAFEFNGNSGPVYLQTGAVDFSFTTIANTPTPGQTATSPVFENRDGDRITLRWTNGDGAGRIVVTRKGSAVSFVPTNGTAYAVNAAFGSGTDMGNDQFIVFNGNGSAVTVTGLLPESEYFFAVYEYNGTGAAIRYRTVPLSANGFTATSPTTVSSDPSTNATTATATLIWTNGNGVGRIVVAKEGSAVTATPVSLTKYMANAVFGSGQQVAAEEFVVYAGTGNSVTVSGLTANKTYHFRVYEFNGAEAPVYNTAQFLTTSVVTSTTLPVQWLYVQANAKNNIVEITWATAQEDNTEYFVVERSRNGRDFQSIGASGAANQSNQVTTYAFTDRTSTTGSVYYRIKQVDQDGKFSFSKVVSVSVVGSGEVRLLQNPVRQQLRFASADSWLGATYFIAGASGRIVYKGTVTSSLATVNLSTSGAGNYFLTVQKKNGQRTTLAFILE